MRAVLLLVGLAMLSVAAPAQTPPLLQGIPEPARVEMSGEKTSQFIISHPTPEYPFEARRHHRAGRGFYYLHVSEETGDVTSVEIPTSTGHRLLDDSALATLKKWKFQPHTLVGVKVPITFTMANHATGKKPKT